MEVSNRMTYFEAALAVLRSARRELTTREITDLALENGFIDPQGKTPAKTMAAVLYNRVQTDARLVKISTQGPRRARRGTVRWTIRTPGKRTVRRPARRSQT